MKPWQGIVPEAEQAAYAKAGLGRPVGFGRKPALLIIDVQYRTVGTSPAPLLVAMDEFSTSCGNTGWQAIPHIVAILACFRKFGWPVLYPYVAPKETFESGIAKTVRWYLDNPAWVESVTSGAYRDWVAKHYA